jgi:8-oxo-dGTP pyrophosphatase MutT (NUDIX family)
MIPHWSACGQKIKSAVLMLLVTHKQKPNGGPALLVLTKRSMNVRTHKGQIGLPGGKREDQDNHPIDTAIREAYEEINAKPDLMRIHGGLEPIATLDNSYVLPVIASTTQEPTTFKKNDEVSEIILAPWTYFDIQSTEEFSFTIFGKTRHSYLFRYKHHNVWGLTASILANAGLH